tara:strand:+ start:24660 stop:24878 length:219 start_codon:yes stop_codon:yes gene_type:complete
MANEKDELRQTELVELLMLLDQKLSDLEAAPKKTSVISFDIKRLNRIRAKLDKKLLDIISNNEVKILTKNLS